MLPKCTPSCVPAEYVYEKKYCDCSGYDAEQHNTAGPYRVEMAP